MLNPYAGRLGHENPVSKIKLQASVFHFFHKQTIHLLALFGAEMILPIADIAFAEMGWDTFALGNPVEVRGLVRGHGFETAQGDNFVN